MDDLEKAAGNCCPWFLQPLPNQDMIQSRVFSMCTQRTLVATSAILIGLMVSQAQAKESARPTNAETLTSFTKTADALLDAAEFSNARWGVVLADLETSTILYSRDLHKSFMPASNLKLFTSAAGLASLGKDFRSTTTLATTAPLVSGVLRGNLLIHGTGDPSISGRYQSRWRNSGTQAPDTTETESANHSTTAILRQWASSIREAGITRIDGDIVALGSGFTSPRAGSWQLDYYPEWYAAEGSGVAINENCFDLRIMPTQEGQPARVERIIVPSHMRIISTVMTSSPSAGNPASAASVTIGRELDGQTILIKGSIPINSPPIVEWGAAHNGDLFSAGLLTDALRNAGIEVTGQPATSPEAELPADARVLYRHLGEPLDRVLVIINKPSQNFYADQLLRIMGRHFGREGSFRAGENVVRDFLTSTGLSLAEARTLRMADGSGLSRQNSVTPQMTLDLLMEMARHQNFDSFSRSLPIAGKDGTLGSRLRGTPLEGRVLAKTGTINGVRCLSGYLTTTQHRRLAFVLMANNFSTPVDRVNTAIDRFLILALSLD